MNKTGILNPEIRSEIARLGHTEYFVIADCGLPLSQCKRVIDISLADNLPSFLDVLRVVAGELVVESFLYAEEMRAENPALLGSMQKVLAGIPGHEMPHETIKQLCNRAACAIRTGEKSPYANVVLVGGVNF